MFDYNKECKTKKGEFLTPIIGEGEFILCATRQGTTVYRKQDEFDFTTQKENKTITAVPKNKKPVKEPVKKIVPAIVEEPKAVKKEEIKLEKKEEIKLDKKELKESKDRQKITKKLIKKDDEKVVSKDNISNNEEYI